MLPTEKMNQIIKSVSFVRFVAPAPLSFLDGDHWAMKPGSCMPFG